MALTVVGLQSRFIDGLSEAMLTRRQLDRGRRQQAAIGSQPRVEARGDQANRDPRRSGISCHFRRRGVRAAASPVTPKFISRSDLAAQWTGAHKGHAFFAYANNYLIDTDHGVIVDVEATRAIRQAEVGGGADNARANRDALRHEAGVIGRRQRLRVGGQPCLARQKARRSLRTFRSSTNQIEPMAHFPGSISKRTPSVTVTPARWARNWFSSGELTPPPERHNGRRDTDSSRHQIGLRPL